MKLIKKLSLLLCALSLCSHVAATQFNFSYTFADGAVANGSLTGTVNGNLVTELSNISVFYKGTGFVGNGSLINEHYDPTVTLVDGIRSYNWALGGGVVSFDGNANNFYFSNKPIQSQTPDNYFSIFTWSTDVNPNANATFFKPTVVSSADWGAQASKYDNRRWQLTSVSPVPEPESYVMLLAGLGLIGSVALRRNKQSI